MGYACHGMDEIHVSVRVQDKHSGSGLKSPAEFETSASKVVLHKKVGKKLYTHFKKGLPFFQLVNSLNKEYRLYPPVHCL